MAKITTIMTRRSNKDWKRKNKKGGILLNLKLVILGSLGIAIVPQHLKSSKTTMIATRMTT